MGTECRLSWPLFSCRGLSHVGVIKALEEAGNVPMTCSTASKLLNSKFMEYFRVSMNALRSQSYIADGFGKNFPVLIY